MILQTTFWSCYCIWGEKAHPKTEKFVLEHWIQYLRESREAQYSPVLGGVKPVLETGKALEELGERYALSGSGFLGFQAGQSRAVRSKAGEAQPAVWRDITPQGILGATQVPVQSRWRQILDCILSLLR